MITAPRQTIVAGETTDHWEIGLVTSAPGVQPQVLAELDDNFTCRLVVSGAPTPIDRAITDKNATGRRFLAWLTAEETAQLGEGTWRVAIAFANPTLLPPLAREIQAVVRIERSLVGGS